MLNKKLNKLCFTFIILFTLIGFSINAQADDLDDNQPDKYVSVKIHADKTKITGGETIRLGAKKTIYPKWHTYWINPGDSGLAFSIDWDLPEGFSVSELEWPTAKKIAYGELTNYGYEGTAVLLQNLQTPKVLPTGPITLKGTANLLACHEICIPETHDVQIILNGEGIHDPVEIEIAQEKLPTPLNNKASYYKDGNNFVIEVGGLETDLKLENAYLLPLEWGAVNNSAEASVTKTNTGFKITQESGERDLSEIKDFEFVLASKDKTKSYSLTAKPSDKKTVTAGLTPSDSTSLNNSSNAGSAPTTFFQAFVFALLGGLILNLMPCVFPVLSMKALSLVQLGDKDENKARLYGISYTAGILISFSLIAAILIGLKSAGAEIGWGFQLQNPIVIALLTYLVFIIGLNLSGFFEFTNRLGNVGSKLANQTGNRGAFFTGVLATLVATPCTAPFMGVAMGYALTQGAVVAILVFLALGLGLALPYLALCFIPVLRTKLPKPGVWMETFKELLSFPMFLTAAFLMWVLSQQANSMGVLLILCALVTITFIIWLWRVRPERGLSRIIAFVTIALSTLYIISAPLLLKTDTSHTQINTDTEQAFSLSALDDSLKSDAPVFTNMTAAWCITCKLNERVALKTNSVQKTFSDKNIIYIKGDWTNRNAEITQYLNSFGRQGVPLYVYYGPRNVRTGLRPAPVVLPQLLTANLVNDAIQ